ncbi:DotI/IcmL/TraM family protein [Facilibium subflavum]|uniref:DotI/IcmL/TraM family protein n=1 Tax=Facilibium subflavum TaxID=2219058 RepID=UPI000E655417|nr:DotI/IcmL/TraM family protein [Facilibium subflavum]
MAVDMLTQIIEKQKFYQVNFRRALSALTISVVINLLLTVLMVTFLTKSPQQYFFAVNQSGQLQQLVENDKVHYSDAMIKNWVAMIVPSLYGLDFLNYKKQMLANEKLFDQQSWDSFTNAFSQTIKQMIRDKLVLKASIQGAPSIIAHSHVYNAQLWKVQVPITIEYQKSDQLDQKSFILTIVVKQQQGQNQLKIMQIIQSHFD